MDPLQKFSLRRSGKASKHQGFTLVELLLAVSIIGVLAAIVANFINIGGVLTDSYDVDRRHASKQLEAALYQQIISEWEVAKNLTIPEGESNAEPICREGIIDTSCVNLDSLTPDYLPNIPEDGAEVNPLHTGYRVYKVDRRPRVLAVHMGELSGEPGNLPGMTVFPTIGLSTTESGGTDSFTIVLDTQPTNDVTMSLSSSDTGEGTVSPASLTFTVDNWSAPQIITVTGVSDAIVDGDIAYTIITATATSADSNYNGVDADDVSATNADINRFFPTADGGEQPASWEIYSSGASTGNTCDSSSCFSTVNETSGPVSACTPSADEALTVLTNTQNANITFDIDTSVLPVGATITDMTITVCVRRTGSGKPPKIQTVRCVSGTCTPSGTDVGLTNTFSDISQNHTTLSITDLSDIEIGLRQTDGARNTEVARILVDIIFAP